MEALGRCGTVRRAGAPGLHGLTVGQLRDLLRAHGLSAEGVRAQLCERIYAAVQEGRIPSEAIAPFGGARAAKTGQHVKKPPTRAQHRSERAQEEEVAPPRLHMARLTTYRPPPTAHTARTLPPSPVTAPFCFQWTDCAERRTVDGWDVDVVPARTLLFHGTKATFPDGILPRVPFYTATLKPASFYAFRSETRGEKGKVISMATTEPLAMLAITHNNLQRLALLQGFPQDAFQNAFLVDLATIERTSHPAWDNIITDFICNQIARGALPGHLHGWTLPRPMRFHDELVVCDTSGIVRMPLEFRFSNALAAAPGHHTDAVLVTWRGRLIDIVPPKCLFTVHWGLHDTPYKPRPQESDRYLLSGEWPLEYLLAITQGTAPRPASFIDVPALFGVHRPACARRHASQH